MPARIRPKLRICFLVLAAIGLTTWILFEAASVGWRSDVARVVLLRTAIVCSLVAMISWIAWAAWHVRQLKTRTVVIVVPAIFALAALPASHLARTRLIKHRLERAGVQYMLAPSRLESSLNSLSAQALGLDRTDMFSSSVGRVIVDLSDSNQAQLAGIDRLSSVVDVQVVKPVQGKEISLELIDWLKRLPPHAEISMSLSLLTQAEIRSLESFDRPLCYFGFFGHALRQEELDYALAQDVKMLHFDKMQFPSKIEALPGAQSCERLVLANCYITGSQVCELAEATACRSLLLFGGPTITPADTQRLSTLKSLRSLALQTPGLRFDELSRLADSDSLRFVGIDKALLAPDEVNALKARFGQISLNLQSVQSP